MSLSFSDRAVIRLPVVMMNGQGEFISGEARSDNPCPEGTATCGRPLSQAPRHHGRESNCPTRGGGGRG